MLPTYITQSEVTKLLRQLDKDISKVKTKLRKQPLTENFGQSDILSLKDKYQKYFYHQATRYTHNRINAFSEYLSDCTNPSSL